MPANYRPLLPLTFFPCAPPSSADQTGVVRRICLSTWPRSGSCEFMRRPVWLSNAGHRKAAANRGRLLFGYFFLAKQEKVTSRRATPGKLSTTASTMLGCLPSFGINEVKRCVSSYCEPFQHMRHFCHPLNVSFFYGEVMKHSRIVLSALGATPFFLALAAHANPAHDQLSSMSEQQRRSVLATFLVKSGEQCSSVTKTFYQGSDKKGNAFWNAACARGDSFVIQVNNDATGTTRILSCKVLKAVNGGTCFTKFKS